MGSICQEFIDYYAKESNNTQEKLIKLCRKYNSNKIESYLEENYLQNEYIHIALLHGIGEFDLYPCLDNDGSIYPYDKEIGLISKDPQIWGSKDSNIESALRYIYHNIIFFTVLSLNWIEIRGTQYNIVVKTLQNNSTSAYYLNDFAFNEDSKFHLTRNWRKTLNDFNKESIEIDELYGIIKKQIR